MNPFVTVVIPSYNHEKYVGAAIDSCLSQTHTNLEVVVVDDGSQDRSVDLLRERYSGDQRITIFTKRHTGAHAAINYRVHGSTTVSESDIWRHIRERDETIVAQAQLVEERWAGRAAYRHFGRSGSLNGRAQVAAPRGGDDL